MHCLFQFIEEYKKANSTLDEETLYAEIASLRILENVEVPGAPKKVEPAKVSLASRCRHSTTNRCCSCFSPRGAMFQLGRATWLEAVVPRSKIQLCGSLASILRNWSRRSILSVALQTICAPQVQTFGLLQLHCLPRRADPFEQRFSTLRWQNQPFTSVSLSPATSSLGEPC